MNLKYEQTGLRAIVYDGDRIQQPDARLFDPGFWRAQGAVVGEAQGRGTALLLDTGFGPAVLRRYRRGGWAAWLSRDRYLFTGFQRSRPVREARMLAYLARQGLPVPHPLGGLCVRSGIRYTGALLMRRIPDAVPLAERLDTLLPEDRVWAETGRLIRRLHETGVVHADLNVHNILLGENGSVHLLDFDRACRAPGARRRFRANLERLKRSLVKWWPASRARSEFAVCWANLVDAYDAPVLPPPPGGARAPDGTEL